MWGLSSPWKALKNRPYVLEKDRERIDAHNRKYSGTKFEIMTDVVPEPFIGNPFAPIWLLNLNPGFVLSDLHHTNNTIVMQKKSAALEADDFWYIDPKFALASGYCWWRKTLEAPIEDYGLDKVMRNFFCVELFPYHSRKFKWSGGLLPSQEFTLTLVRRAVVEGKRFIIMRQRNNWLKHVRGLGKVSTSVSNPRNAIISRKNLKQPNFLREIL